MAKNLIALGRIKSVRTEYQDFNPKRISNA